MSTPFSLYSQAFKGIQRNTWILAVAMFINRSGAMVLLFASLYFTDELHFSIGEAGVIMSLYGLGSILGSFAGGWLTDRYNFFNIMVISLFGSGLILPLLVVMKTFTGVAIVICVYAFMADLFRPAMSKGIAFYSDSANRTRSIALIRLAINLGFSLGPAMGGLVAYYLGYRPLLIIDACTSAMAGVLLLVYLPRKPIQPASATAAQPVSVARSAYRDFSYLLFIVLVSLYGMCFFQLFASVPQYLDKVWHYTEDEIGWALALNGFLVVVIEMPLVVVLEKKTRIFHFIIAGAACIPIAFAILYAGHGLVFWVIIYTIVITLSEILCMPFMMNFSLSRPAPERQGEYAALYSIAYGIANIGAPLLGLGIADRYSFDTMFTVLITVSTVTTVGFILINNRLKKESRTEWQINEPGY